MPVYILATLDTKGHEAAFVQQRLNSAGVAAVIVDSGCQGMPSVTADISREDLFLAGGASVAELRQKGDRGLAVSTAARCAEALITARHALGQVDGVIGLGGSAGTTIATTAMRALPLGLPKLMISTLASGQTRPYVGDKDILMLNSVTDILGINRISRKVLAEGANAMAGMVRFGQTVSPDSSADRPLIAATMFGVTTPCVMKAKEILEEAGYEVIVFHATGNGGQAMEALIADGLIAGVLDITTTELADELVGGVLTAGPDRLTAAGKRGVPQLISVGALDMVNFGPFETVPAKFKDRKFYKHNANVTLMRTTPAENKLLGEEIGRKAAAARGPTTILVPTRGVSAIDNEEQPFDDPEARDALREGLRETAGAVELVEVDLHINDPQFAELCARQLLELIRSQTDRPAS